MAQNELQPTLKGREKKGVRLEPFGACCPVLSRGKNPILPEMGEWDPPGERSHRFRPVHSLLPAGRTPSQQRSRLGRIVDEVPGDLDHMSP